MSFEEEYQSFLDQHEKAREGERLRRLKEGHGKAELSFLQNVWWPLFHHFDYLHPEYEVDDFKDGKRYLDYAYIRPGVKICFEVDGYGPHLKNISRWQFADQLERQNQLIIDEWTVIRFSYDQILEQPRRCQQTTQQIIGKSLGADPHHKTLTFIEKEVIRFVINKGTAVTPAEVEKLLKLSDKTARKILSQMVQKKILYPATGRQRIRSYRLGEGVQNPLCRI
ncbi:DNA-binding response regulator [Ammoniphilus sp. CFH 90114]|uniref:DNA-binding response regulator n=1 Tax=Ammoniphilus sp. CFH 90114 TaxID=2493665 RepID=UPI00100F5B8D|nr:DNA-binding response regulator [Ammoniphilus sp. CFH 90114]RXT05205.1 DNA-binding response regulator [Ammoniphilus sp. CFH 90114]